MSMVNFERLLKFDDYSHEQWVDLVVTAQTLCTLAYFVSAIILIDNSYAGFNGVLLALIQGATIGLSYKGLRKTPDRTIFGVILGVVFVLLFATLQNAIFWGQYSGCEVYSASTSDSKHRQLTGVECSHTMAMSSMCTFSIFMFLSYLIQLAVMIKFKNEILGNPSNPSGAGGRAGYVPVSRSTGSTVTGGAPQNRFPDSMDI